LVFSFNLSVLDVFPARLHDLTVKFQQQDGHMSRNPNTDPPQPSQQPELPVIQPNDPVQPDPMQPEPLPLPPDDEPKAPVQEPDAAPLAGDPPTSEPTRFF
jgi:hypothetical protein